MKDNKAHVRNESSLQNTKNAPTPCTRGKAQERRGDIIPQLHDVFLRRSITIVSNGLLAAKLCLGLCPQTRKTKTTWRIDL